MKNNHKLITREELQALFDEQQDVGREFIDFLRRTKSEDGSTYDIWQDKRTGETFAVWQPRTVYFGLNDIPEEKVQELIRIVEREGEARASWSCDGRTRHQMLACQLARMLPQYSFDIGYDYRCNVSKCHPKDGRDTFEVMVQDWLADNAEEMDDLRLTGEPHIGEDGCWMQEAETVMHTYTLVALTDGNIHLRYTGTK